MRRGLLEDECQHYGEKREDSHKQVAVLPDCMENDQALERRQKREVEPPNAYGEDAVHEVVFGLLFLGWS